MPASTPRPWSQRSRSALLAGALAATGALASAAPKVEDTMAQRVQACTGCHGPQGRAASDGYYPRIAGKPAGYLYQQLLGFRDGRRHYALMTNLLAPLSDAYLREIAEHFAHLDVPYPPPQPASADAATLTRGETLVRHGDAALQVPACSACHGAALLGVAPAVPALIGMPRDYLNAQLGAWRTASRHALAPDCMAQVARALAPQDIAALSQWLAAQPVPAGAHPATTLPAAPPLRCGGVPADIAAGAGKP
jgi:cytochrome c553